jgi:hypothetical protein
MIELKRFEGAPNGYPFAPLRAGEEDGPPPPHKEFFFRYYLLLSFMLETSIPCNNSLFFFPMQMYA